LAGLKQAEKILDRKRAGLGLRSIGPGRAMIFFVHYWLAGCQEGQPAFTKMFRDVNLKCVLKLSVMGELVVNFGHYIANSCRMVVVVKLL